MLNRLITLIRSLAFLPKQRLSVASQKSNLDEKEIYSEERSTFQGRKLLQALEYRTHELEKLTAITAHDLRAPLVNLKGFHAALTESLEQVNRIIFSSGIQLPAQEQQKLTEIMDYEIPESLHYIEHSTLRIEKLIVAFMAVLRAENRQMQLSPILTDTIVNRVLHNFQHQLQTAGIVVDLSLLSPIEITADLHSLEQVFSNLIENAIKYLDSQRPGQIIIRAAQRKRHILFMISDNGIGIPPVSRDKVFTIFKRATNVMHIPGDGIGLAHVKAIIHRHNGRIWYKSTVGKGTTFFFTIDRNLQEYLTVT